ncbi:hypothetical protein K8Z61_08260 [Nocardioides sp. TRM66260-LWL]|uniref:hypothetical protein n=1 Tax=Nocardioides sp. TRM66260-LWL TaxID=2874478 RepID=UPI001CC53582|nr:hypothetical protein [Nocardioides sp. TRM66260-LWL]MBZ5734489.1 hypothetical protein [Nocardioides sp. TRM66260-LWL]
MSGGGRRAAPRRSRPRAPLAARLPQLGLSAGVTVLLVAWGYLVFLAIDLGDRARRGTEDAALAWLLLALATVGAVACLFLVLLLGTRLWRSLTAPPGRPDAPRDDRPDEPRPPGGRRAAR